MLLDISMPGREGLETVRALKAAFIEVFILTVPPEYEYAVRCLRLGVDGYLNKDVSARRTAEGGDESCGGQQIP